MEISTIQKLCQKLIGIAYQRCRISETLCRLSIVLKTSINSGLPIVRIAISDTGLGSSLEEFRDPDFARVSVSAKIWDGVLSITTTTISDGEIYHYRLNLKENVAARRLKRLPPTHKNAGRFSGTEVSLTTYECIGDLVAGIKHFLPEMLILKIPKVTVELVVDRTESSGLGSEHIILANEGNTLCFPMTNIEHLVSGLEDHVLKHANTFDKECQSCFSSRANMKVGSGTTCSSESLRSISQVIDAVIIITELPEPSSPSCLGACSTMTKVFYLQDYLPCAIPQSSVNALTSIDWKSYGLRVRGNDVSESGHLVLEWENLPPFSHIDIVIHCYQKQTLALPVRQKSQYDKNLVKKAVKLATDDLKERYAGILLSAQALKIQSYVPDLASSIAGLILLSNDLDFQGECISLIGLQHQDICKEKVEDCIRKKIIHAIELNDRIPTRSKESAPILFDDESIPEAEFQDEEDGGEEDFGIFDL